MNKSKRLIWLSFLVLLLLVYVLTELYFIFNPDLTPFIGITKNIFYVYIAIICVFIYIISIKAYIDDSSNSESFILGGSIILIIASIFSFLQLLSHILLALPPINSEDYMNWNFFSDIPFIILVALLNVPFLLKFYRPMDHLKST